MTDIDKLMIVFTIVAILWVAQAYTWYRIEAKLKDIIQANVARMNTQAEYIAILEKEVNELKGLDTVHDFPADTDGK